MEKYIVTWIVSVVIPISCPLKNSVDEFGITSNYSWSCSVLHTDSSERTETKIFVDVDSANAFYNRAKKDSELLSNYYLGESIKEVKLDTVFYINNLKIKPND